MAGIAAVYANQFADQSQLASDAGGFFEISSLSPLRYLPLIQLQALHEGSLAIKIYSSAYDFFSVLGFPRERYVGILINVCSVALTGVLTLKMSRLLYGCDVIRFRRLILIFSFCGLFWLFSGIHLRDSIVLLSSTALSYVWLYFLQKPDLSYRFIAVTASSLLAGFTFGFLRGEFILVPIGTVMAATAALMFSVKSKRIFITFFFVFTGIVLAGWLLLMFGDSIQFISTRGYEGYVDLVADQHGADSLGMSLIVNQPMPIRLLLGSIYLFIFPIPFWSGFQIESAYYLFKSFNAIFLYFLLPLLVLSIDQIWKNKLIRSPSLLYLVFTSFGFTLAIACTSLETRHFAVFLPLMFLLSLLLDLTIRSVVLVIYIS